MDESVSLARLVHRLEEVVGGLRGIPVDVERVDDDELVRQQIAQVVPAAGELRAMHPWYPRTEKGSEEREGRRRVLDALERGMKMRTIVHASVMDDPRKAGRVRQLHAAGDLYRIVDEPIQQLLVFDRVVAFLRMTPFAYAPGTLVIRQQSLLTALIDLFERTWAGAREINEPTHRLSAREREVLALIAEGRSNSAVARALSITEAAVGKHVASLFTKLDLPETPDDNRRVLAVLAYLRGMVR
ncbi:helix-turn-helix transcriptional regulator [Nonomuraea turkmeniaca]|nr:helix-turn-helix transcriptional regulator [Nonomuraea turkmeniaca]